MTANTKPGSPRLGLAPVIALATALVGPAAVLSLSAFAAPAAAEAPVALAAPAVPIAAAVAPSALIETIATVTPRPETVYEKIGAGMASYYGRELAGNRTASGERFDPSDLTAAHRTLPLGSKVRVTNPRTGDSVIVRINDRGPFHGNRLIDLSEAAAREIGIRAAGRGMVEIAVAAD
jgi:rare lipoprotein A